MTAPRPKRELTPPTIIQAMDNPALFGAWFEGSSWGAWRVFLKALFALPLDPGEIEVFKACTGREVPPSKKCSYAALAIGRRGGKSRVLSMLAVYHAAFFDWRPFLSPGETGVIACVAADRKQAAVLLKYVRGMLNSVPMLMKLVLRETQSEIELRTGVSIEIMTSDFRLVRGRTVVAALIDEIAFLPTGEFSATPDTEVVTALKPAMATIPGSMMLVSSSPYARRGVLYRDYRRLWGQDVPGELCWCADTRTMNPGISQSFIDSEFEKDPASAAAEYGRETPPGAQFRSDIDAYISREAVEAAVVPGRFELPYALGRRYVAGLDPSGGAGQDSMALSIAFRDGDARVLAVLREWKPRFSPDQVVQEAAALLKSYKLNRCWSDKYSGDWVASRFRAEGITVQFNDKSASQIYLEFLPLLNSGRIQLLDNPRLVNQLCALERRKGSNRELISHSPGGHDDLAVTAAIALVAAEARPPMIISDRALEQSKIPAGMGPYRRPLVVF